MHVFAPTSLAKDEANYKKSCEVLQDNGITPDFAADPRQDELAVAKTYFDRIFGEGLYRVLPASASFRSYPNASRHIAADGLVELCVARLDGLGFYIWQERDTEWDKVGMPENADPVLRNSALAADLIGDLIATSTDIPDSRHIRDDDPWGGFSRLLRDLIVFTTGMSEGRFVDVPPFPLPARVAIGLAFPELLEATGRAHVEALPIHDDARKLISDVTIELHSDNVAKDLVRAAAGTSWMTPSGLVAWYERIPEHVREEAGIAASSVLPESTFGAQAKSGEVPFVPGEPAPVAQTHPSPVLSGEHNLFAELDDITLRTQEQADRLRDDIRSRLSAAQSTREEIDALHQKVVALTRDLAGADEALHALEDQIDDAIEDDHRRRAAALSVILSGAEPTLTNAVKQWVERREERDRQHAKWTPEEEKYHRVLTSYNESVRSGTLDALQPTLRQVIEDQAQLAKDKLGPDWYSAATEWTDPHTVLPVALSLSIRAGRIRVGAALPFNGTRSDALSGDGPDTALAAVTTRQMAILLGELAAADGDHHVEAQGILAKVTLVWFEGEYRGAENDNLSDAEAYYALLCQDAARANETLLSAGVAAQFRPLPAELLEGLATLKVEGSDA